MTTRFSSKQSSTLLAVLLMLALASFPARAHLSNSAEDFEALSVTANPHGPSTAVGTSCGWELAFEVQVGAYELRGGSDTFDVIVTYHNRASQRIANVNQGRRWAAGTTQRFVALLGDPDGPGMIADIEFRASSMDGRWDVASLAVVARGEGRQAELYRGSGAPLFSFAGEHTNWSLLR